MSPVSKEAMAFMVELDELCKKHGLVVLTPDEGVYVKDLREGFSWVSCAEWCMEDISRFGGDS